jgi:cysteate synthase
MAEEHYRLNCLGCGQSFEDSNSEFLLDCGAGHSPAMLRAEYRRIEFDVHPEEPGIFRYRSWLPIRHTLPSIARPVVFPSRFLGPRMGLENLFIAFSGYWTERGAFLTTCSFKELEALAVCGRLDSGWQRCLVVASAGNTGRAFLQIASEQEIPVLVVVPESALGQMWTTRPRSAGARLAVVKGEADYFDAIRLAGLIAAEEGYSPEGGARNVARRDGMGTVVLAAAEELGCLPDHYVQAVGSGTGGIAAWEAALRLSADPLFRGRSMKLHFVQNAPFAPMVEAWQKRERRSAFAHCGCVKEHIAMLHAPVLSNRQPPYGIRGGVFDALQASGGCMYAVSNAEARAAGALFENLEGCDLDPAAEIAVGGLILAVDSGAIGRKDVVLLNVTGGGSRRLAREINRYPAAAELEFSVEEIDALAVSRKLRRRRAAVWV